MKGFWREFLSSSNEQVNSATVIVLLVGIILAAPVMALCFAAVYHHVWELKKGLDGPAAQVLIAMLGAATGGLGGAMFSRTLGGSMPGPPPGWAPPPKPPPKES